ncbi:hypothetical protein E2C01_059344 [Portunus trituberculatus]|uniref:Uncharacterized protein n=1 Tax=Portunus trituberculatus TaxID=210409 RepID=A0A5B7H2A3_PORTR|nr:hypothetical protein [Portunus trituberculatus]
MYILSACSLVRKRRVVISGQVVTASLSCEIQRETFSKVTTIFMVSQSTP